MARPELGIKRVCQNCGAKFYDLSRDPIVCPRCGTSFPVTAYAVTSARGRADARAAAVVKDEVEEAPVGDVELVSLEDADAEASGGAVEEDDVELEEDIADAEPFLEEEEGGDDVSDLIGGDLEEDEES